MIINSKFEIENLKLKRGSAWAGVVILIFFIISVGLALTSDVTGTLAKAKRANQAVVAQTLAEAGIEKAVWKINQNSGYTGETNISLPTGTLDISVQTIDQTNKYIEATAYTPSKSDPKVTRKVRAKIFADLNSSSASFHYGVQVGGLGVEMSNNAKIFGNVYADGTIIGGNGSEITGDAFVSGSLNKIDGVKIGSDARAHTIKDSSVGRDAYYTVLQNTSVARSKYPGSPDPAAVGTPLAQSTVDLWETWAAAGGTYSGNYVIDGVSAAVGPKKIDGDLVVTNGATLTITGVIWVTGNISFSNNAIIKLASNYGPSSGMLIADSQTDKTNYGKANVSNNVNIQGSGNPSSYVMIVATNTGSTIANPAIFAGNNSNAVVYYATTGIIEVANNASLRALSGGGLHLSNGAQISYDSGLANANFSGGPGGSWRVKEWQVIH
jgi:hypothetical protein